nr:hypothetical protein [Eubacterium sp.]
PVLKKKMAAYDTEFMGQLIVTDDRKGITDAILSFVEDGADLVLCSGGMSVDPDDKTPGAIRDTGTEVVSYGAPVLPGAMFLLSYLTVDKEGNLVDIEENKANDVGTAMDTADAEMNTARIKGRRVVPVLGLPGCIMYAKRTIFDLVLPRVLAGERLKAEDLVRYGEGGLCLSCDVCHFPNCSFGK